MTRSTTHKPAIAQLDARAVGPVLRPRPGSNPSSAGLADRACTSRAEIPGPAPVAIAILADQNRGGATSFRCGGCGAVSHFAHREQQYGRLVLRFLDQHGPCGNAVEITAGPQDDPDV